MQLNGAATRKVGRKTGFAVLASAVGIVLAAAPAVAQQATAGGPAASSAPLQPPAGSVGGLGDVNIYPKRVVIDDRQRIATVGLYNRGVGQGDYEITVVDRMMTPDGQIVDLASVADPAARARVKTASSMLRWSPRRVVLRANEAQTVRLMARVAPDLPPGEYRSHFIATAIPEGGSNLTIDDVAGKSQDDGIGVRIVPRFGISIPVILRVGQTTLTVGLRDARVVSGPDGRRSIGFTITRQGSRSAFGDVVVTAAGARKPVAAAKGIGVYTEIDSRAVLLPLDPAVDPRLVAPGARLTITYTDDDAAPGTVLASSDFTLP